MTKKKKAKITASVSEEDNTQAKDVLEHYHQIALELRGSRNQEQAEAALTEVNNMPEGAQIALLKALAKERQQDAADVLAAINVLSSIKNVHKEARRSLIQLEGARIYPQWRLPVPQPFALQPAGFAGLDELDDEEDFDEDEDELIDFHDLLPEEVVITFIESLFEDDYESAYILLSSQSPLREGLSMDEWVERREQWAEEAEPGELEPGFVYEHPSQQSLLVLPPSVSRSSNIKEIEAGWSAEMDDIDLNDTLPELPKATAVNEETQRHWFWATYTLVQEDDEWRIQNMVDEGANAQNLSIEELQQKIHELDEYVDEFRAKYSLEAIEQFTETESQFFAGEIFRRILQANAYADSLIEKTTLDRSLYEDAAARMLVFDQTEHCLVYLEPLARQFEEGRAENLRRMALIQQVLSDKYADQGDDEHEIRFQELAEESLKESLAIEENLDARIALAELLIDTDRFDEAEEHLLRAQALVSTPAQEAHVEKHMGEVATGQEQYEEALSHYQRVAELEPETPDSWSDLADAYEHLDNLQMADANYRRAIGLAPDDDDLYYSLSNMYSRHGQPEKAM